MYRGDYFMEETIVDILVPMSGKGGVESVINSVAVKMKNCGMRIRVVQMVYSGPEWTCDAIEFYPLLVGGKVECVEDFVGMYISFLTTHEKPDAVIATPWPFMTYVARAAVNAVNVSPVIIAWLHAPIETYKQYGTGGIECLSFADSCFVLTNKARQQILNIIPHMNVEIVGNPVDMNGISVNDTWNKSARKLIFVGRLSEEKRVDVILHAIARTKNEWKLRVVGDGDKRADLEQLSTQIGIEERVTWDGWQDNPWHDYNDITALVVASDYEGFCMAAVEALARGIPVISTPVDGIVEYIMPGYNGYFFSKGSSDELAQILDVIDSGDLPDIIPYNCVHSVDKYEHERVVGQFVVKIQELLDKD